MIKNLLAKLAVGGVILGFSLIISSLFIGLTPRPELSPGLPSLNIQYFPLAFRVFILATGVIIASLTLIKVAGSNFFGITGIQDNWGWPLSIIMFLSVIADTLFGTADSDLQVGPFSSGAAFMISIYLIVSLLKNRKSTKR